MRSEFLQEELAREDVWVDGEGLIHYRKVSNNAQLVNDNMDRKKDPAKGFTPERTMQHLARVPAEVYHAWAKKTGYYEMDHEQKKKAKYMFLRDNPQWWTVENLVTPSPNKGHIFTK